MDWFGGRVNLSNLDLAGAVNKLSESVKNIERNFDTALFDGENSESTGEAPGPESSSTSRKVLSEGEETVKEVTNEECKPETSKQLDTTEPSPASIEVEKKDAGSGPVDPIADVKPSPPQGSEQTTEQQGFPRIHSPEAERAVVENFEKQERDSNLLQTASFEVNSGKVEIIDSSKQLDPENVHGGSLEQSEPVEVKLEADEAHRSPNDSINQDESDNIIYTGDHMEEQVVGVSLEEGPERPRKTLVDIHEKIETEASQTRSIIEESDIPCETHCNQLPPEPPSDRASEVVPSSAQGTISGADLEVAPSSAQGTISGAESDEVIAPEKNDEVDSREHKLSSPSNVLDSAEAVVELEKAKRDMKMMETALQGAARQSQAKADEIAKLMNENEHLKSMVEDLQRKSIEAGEIESLREEYHQRVATLERKVYALTKERDTLRREQNKKSDAAALLKEKDEIINQIMAEGEELSKKQATQEATIRKLRAQVRELEEEKKGLLTKLQVEENKVESIKKDKAATERLLQETIEKHQAELSAQKDYYTNALNAAKEAEALAEARANDEARTELESRLNIAGEREEMLVKALEELRQTLTRQEQQAAFKEDMLCRDMEDLQRRYQASERRCEELITQVPESTRPLLRQIEAMKESTDRRAEVWAAVERTLNSRLQEAEAKAAAAEERERSVSERLSQTLSRINVLEAQISCLRAEQTQLTRSLEKERQRAAENRQEYLAVKEESDTNEGRANQLEQELRELKKKHKQELHESLTHRELLEQELEREKAARSELERTSRVQPSDQIPVTKQKSASENGSLTRKLSSASSIGNMEESFFLQASLDSDNFSERRNSGESTISPYYLKSMTPSAFEAALRQKEGELSSYVSRLATMESIRDSLAEELVKMTEQCEKLRTEAAGLPGIRAELEALRRRHAAALELMGERDEELEELRADIVDLKEMYREQVNLLVNKIQVLSSQIGVA